MLSRVLKSREQRKGLLFGLASWIKEVEQLHPFPLAWDFLLRRTDATANATDNTAKAAEDYIS